MFVSVQKCLLMGISSSEWHHSAKEVKSSSPRFCLLQERFLMWTCGAQECLWRVTLLSMMLMAWGP